MKVVEKVNGMWDIFLYIDFIRGEDSVSSVRTEPISRLTESIFFPNSRTGTES